MTRFVNLTPHTISIYSQTGSEVLQSWPPSGRVARLVDATGPATTAPLLGGIEAAVPTPLEDRRLDGLPAPEAGVVYLCSILCLAAARAAGRYDVAAPDTDTGVVRDSSGRILGTTRLLLAGDPPPAYRLVTGSATHTQEPCPACDGGRRAPCQMCGDGGWVPPRGGTWGAPADLDVFGWGGRDALDDPFSSLCAVYPVSTAENVALMFAERRRLGSEGHPRVVDYTEQAPQLEGGEWVIYVPVWGEEDPSRPELIWHSPTARPVRVERRIQNTGPAELKRWALAGGPRPAERSTWTVELSVGSHAAADSAYRGSGLRAWRSAFAVVETARLTKVLPPELRELSAALLARSIEDLARIANLAHALMNESVPCPAELSQYVTGSPRAGKRVALLWAQTGEGWRWKAHYSEEGRWSFEEVLSDWEQVAA